MATRGTAAGLGGVEGTSGQQDLAMEVEASLPLVREVAGGLKVRVRTMKQGDVDSIFAMMAEDGWLENPCEYDLLLEADPQCWMVAEEADTGRVVGHCCGLKVGEHLAAVQAYIVAPDYQRRGIGSLLWSRLMEKFQGRTLVLSTEDCYLPMYSRIGLQPLYRWEILEGKFSKEKLPAPRDSDISVCELSSNSPELGEVEAYDRGISLSDRSAILEACISHERSRAVAAFQSCSKSPLGYGVLFQAEDKWHLSPLYAECDEAAWLMARRLLEDVADGDTLVTWTPSANESACSVWHAMGFACHTEYHLITEDTESLSGKVPLHKVFSLFSSAPFGYI